MSATIAAIADLISRPAFWVCVGLLLLYCIFMAWVDTLDAPKPTDSNFYKHAFRFLNQLAFRMNRAAIAFHVPIEQEDKPDASN